MPIQHMVYPGGQFSDNASYMSKDLFVLACGLIIVTVAESATDWLLVAVSFLVA